MEAEATSRVDPDPAAPASSRFKPPEPDELSKHFPQLEILELLGHGGMGAVYKARQPALDRLVAVKILPPEVAEDPKFSERFTREARALAQLSHPNIVGIHDSGQIDGIYYFVMEFVDGVDLRHMVQTGDLKPQEALAIVPQICDALQYAHNEGLVHRDIKPENILLDRKGRVKIADFGLAKLLGKRPEDISLTGPGHVMGTPHYMAPEQMEHPLEVDHRADIYSLGVVLYEMLTGELPLGRFDPPSKKIQVDVRLDQVVLKSLEKEPQRRYQQASEVKTDVESLVSDGSRSPREKTGVRDAPGHRAIQRQVQGAAKALLAAGLITLCSGVLTIGLFYGIDDDSLDTSIRALKTNDLAEFTVVGLQVLTLPIAGLVVLGAVGMRRLHFYWIASVGSILVLIPFTPGWLLSLPLGIWSLAVLTRGEVQRAFRMSDEKGTTAKTPTRPPLRRLQA